jgi:Tc toxin complex TcA C-terminal TcB-binding domain
MANLIIIRLHPDEPVSGTDFTSYLEGLTINAYDLSYANPTANPATATLIGSATFLDQGNANFGDVTKNQIQQHATLLNLPFPAELVTVDVGGSVPESVATAMIVVNEPAGYAEYVSPDLLLQITRAGVTIAETTLYYDVVVSTTAVPGTSQEIVDLQPTALYLPLTAPADNVLFTMPSDGSAPSFAALKTAVQAVLAADPGGAPDLSNLLQGPGGAYSTDRCANVANEIIWGPQYPLPGLPSATSPNFFTGPLEEMYTDPPNDGSTSNPLEQSRQQFEGSLASYYSTHGADAQRLTKYVVALAAAVATNEQSQALTTAFVEFPVNPSGTSILATVDETEIAVTGLPAGDLTVPEDYFYVLGASLPVQITPAQRFAMATGDNADRLIAALQAGLDAGTIGAQPINPAQAARRLAAMVTPPFGTTVCPVTPSIQGVVEAWLAYPGDDDTILTGFWQPEATGVATEGQFLDLVLAALTQSWVITGTATLLATEIKGDLTRGTGPGTPPPQHIVSVADLPLATPQDWKTFFDDSPGWPNNLGYLPSYTAPGTPDVRVNAFIRYVQKFFDLSLATTPPPDIDEDVAPLLPLPTNDPIAAFVVAYEALTAPGFTFGAGALNAGDVQLASQTVFPGDADAQAWLVQRINTLNDLCQICAVISNVPPPVPPSLPFSIAEGLYARGYTSIADVQAVTATYFQYSLRGTVAYDSAAAIYAAAGAVGPVIPVTPGPFQPVNPGTLVNCIPPCHLSPLGPVEYLHELLQLSQASTCKTPFAPPPAGTQSLGDTITARRGPLGNLHATAANLDTPLPLIDIVNENLESLVTTIPASTAGVVYDTEGADMDGHKICQSSCGNASEESDEDRHPAAELFGTLPQYSAPATPVALPAAYANLKADFSTPALPYSEPMDICRSYLEQLGTCRFETMRTHRKEITEFALDPTLTAPEFQTHLWRFPVRLEMAVEYLGITPEENQFLFEADIATVATTGQLSLPNLYGFNPDSQRGEDWVTVVTQLPQFLTRTGLTYCELVDLQQAGFVAFDATNEGDRIGVLPNCEPCCLNHYGIVFTNPQDPQTALRELIVFLRLWRKMQNVCGARYNFAELTDICNFFQLFIGTTVNPDFVRQLAAFQMLRDYFCLQLISDAVQPGAIGDERTQLLSLWAGPTAKYWHWAVHELLRHIPHYAKLRHACETRPPEFIKLLASNLDPLSSLAGFNPANPPDTWNTKPTHTLRFAEVLAKIYASHFGVGELVYLFTAQDHLDGDDPFPLQAENDALDKPLGLPGDEHRHSLWTLRKKLLCVEISREEEDTWSWSRLEAMLRHEFGYTSTGGSDPLLSIGQHFFPGILESQGFSSSPLDRQYRIALPGANAAMWNTPPDGPFRYDAGAAMLWTQLPVRDHAVIEKLVHLRQLNAAEIAAVQNLYFAPRADLATFSSFFTNIGEAEKFLIQEPDEAERWRYFQRQFALAHKRCRIIADHLAEHVASVTRQKAEDCAREAWLLLQNLFADGNFAKTPWEDNSGQVPLVTWQPPPDGGAFAALLGLTGTGLLGQYTDANGALAWRELRGPMTAFGHDADGQNCPILTVIPALNATLTPDQQAFVGIRNGFAIDDVNGSTLGGAENYSVRWSGQLLVEQDGEYEFRAGAPRPDHEEPNPEEAEHHKWKITLSRGQKTWVVLRHRWHDEPGEAQAALHLRHGAYHIVVEFAGAKSAFSNADEVCRQRTGFQVKYKGPDSCDKLIAIPFERLYRDRVEEPLNFGMQWPQGSNAEKALQSQNSSSLRDIRRTYQRAFKALLFARRFNLSAKSTAPFKQSELGYMLAHPDLFAGVSYYRNPILFARHNAYFDFNFLPLLDSFHPPQAVQDDRVQPSAQRIQAMFDWWERMFDYTQMRRQTRGEREHRVWELFEEAAENQPDDPAQLLRHMGVDLRHDNPVLSYFVNQASPVYAVTASDLEDDRWAVRVWHAERWTRLLLHCFAPADITFARPDLWASDDPGSLVAGETVIGDENLTLFVDNGCFENGEPARYENVRRLNDGLRERAREALLSYLCALNRVPLPWTTPPFAQSPRDLSDLLLIDVETGICERASRIEEAIVAVQNFMRRARLGLEPSWTVTAEFAFLWEREFATFKIWEACKRRQLYKENWIDWDDLRKAKKIEAFQFLESELHRNTLTMPVPGGLEYWPDQLPPSHPALLFLQKRDPSALQLLNPAREGLGVLGTPEWDARPSWLAPLPSENDVPPTPTPNPPTPIQSAAMLPHIAAAKPQAFVSNPTTGGSQPSLPFWIQSAIRMGVRFYRIAAGGVPPAAAPFQPADFHARPGCCHRCGCDHPPLVDEYYFWLVDCALYAGEVSPANYEIEPDPQDPAYDQTAGGATSQTSTTWHDPTLIPKMLAWNPEPAVRLAWCRVHNGQFEQPRRSTDCVVVAENTAPDLVYVGRLGDSLTFQVTNGIAPDGYTGAEQPGFRFDLASDEAVLLPLVSDIPGVASANPAGLPAYPYFVYVKPGDSLFPYFLFPPALAVSRSLRTHCRFEAALKWLELVFNPLVQDCTWMDCGGDSPTPPPNLPPSTNQPPPTIQLRNPNREDASMQSVSRAVGTSREDSDSPPETCCDSTNISDFDARNRSILLHFLETVLEWALAEKCRNSPQAFAQARLLLDTAARILGPRPLAIVNSAVPNTPVQAVSTFVPLYPPLNPRLMALYCHTYEQLALVHHCDDARRLHNGRPNIDMPFWGEDACRRDWRGLEGVCADESNWCHPHSPYRFLFLVQKAQEFASQVRELGAALLSAFEKGDAEYLASLHAVQETQLMELTLRIRKNQWRDADWQVQALGLTKEVSQTNRRYYAALIQNGLINNENQYENNTSSALAARTVSTVTEAIGEFMQLIPDLFVGFPCEETWLPLGTKLAGMFQAIARISNDFAEIYGTTAGLNLTEAGWDRRLQDWVHQVEDLDIEIEQMEIQILGAERRRDQAIQEINNQQLQIEQSHETLNFLRDKFTNHELYLFLQKETAALYFKMYEIALSAALQAEHAFNFERGHTHRKFLPCNPWDNMHQGLLAGERLELTLRHMEKEYLDLNRREYELTKNFSLRLHFPMQYLRLMMTGKCEIELSEWMFDLDYPGQYMRRIKNVSVTLPCVTGPYTGVHCRLTLLSSETRVDPCLAPAPKCCCKAKVPDRCRCKKPKDAGYEASPQDGRIYRQFAAREAIATSTGQNDSGLFQLNFSDERYLPFEYLGAVSRWRIELPMENNYFDFNSLADVVLQLNYTSREGGDPLRRAAMEAARCKLPGDGWSFIDVRHEFPDAWELFNRSCNDRRSARELTLRLNRKLFPFLPSDPQIRVTKFALLFETEEMLERECPEITACPCPEEKVRARHVVKFKNKPVDDDCGCGERHISCYASDEWPRLYHGVADSRLRPFRGDRFPRPITFCFPEECGEVVRAYLFCRYEVVEECCEARGAGEDVKSREEDMMMEAGD